MLETSARAVTFRQHQLGSLGRRRPSIVNVHRYYTATVVAGDKDDARPRTICCRVAVTGVRASEAFPVRVGGRQICNAPENIPLRRTSPRRYSSTPVSLALCCAKPIVCVYVRSIMVLHRSILYLAHVFDRAVRRLKWVEAKYDLHNLLSHQSKPLPVRHHEDFLIIIPLVQRLREYRSI